MERKRPSGTPKTAEVTPFTVLFSNRSARAWVPCNPIWLLPRSRVDSTYRTIDENHCEAQGWEGENWFVYHVCLQTIAETLNTFIGNGVVLKIEHCQRLQRSMKFHTLQLAIYLVCRQDSAQRGDTCKWHAIPTHYEFFEGLIESHRLDDYHEEKTLQCCSVAMHKENLFHRIPVDSLPYSRSSVSSGNYSTQRYRSNSHTSLFCKIAASCCTVWWPILHASKMRLIIIWRRVPGNKVASNIVFIT